MVFSFGHSFKQVSETTTVDTDSPSVQIGSTCWRLSIRVQQEDFTENLQICLFGFPNHEILHDTVFEIEANYTAIIGSHVQDKANYTIEASGKKFCKWDYGETDYAGTVLFHHPFELIKNKDFYLLKDDEMTISVYVNIISVKGIDYFPLYTFENEFQDSDLTLSFKFPDFPYDTTFHLHSQILSFHCEYFKELLQAECEDQIKVEQTQVVQKAGKKNLVVDLQDEFNPYLIRTYFSILYSSGYNLINEFNVKELLKLNFIWKSKTILAHVDMFFVSNLDLLEIPIEEIIVLAWKHDLTTLKLIVLKKMISVDLFLEISKLENYQTMSPDNKSDLTERILFNSIFNANPYFQRVP